MWAKAGGGPLGVPAHAQVFSRERRAQYAHRHYGDADLWPRILEANRDTIDDSDEIFTGQMVRIPRLG